MANPLGSILGAVAAPIIGGLFQNKANKDNEANQREFAQMGIRWKVEDAKAAGLHPLFALGGGGATYTPSAQPLMTGQDVARAAAAADPSLREMHQAQVAALQAAARKDDALALAAASDAARSAQAENPTPGIPQAVAYQVYDPRTDFQGFETAEMRAARMQGNPTSLDPVQRDVFGIEPGVSKLLQRFELVDGTIMLLPSQKASESLESLESAYTAALLAGQNISATRRDAIAQKNRLLRSMEDRLNRLRKEARSPGFGLGIGR